ncbi:hypothetical protein Zmor_003894 [Zophobas morio]|uniref:Uncharacterized protein n=1 Tax=Zophobas morio TaxID=2755281 RepID=A0AA38HKE2_9CUCU|nr:hypothetical protein Zmor_003894 [Zophobas morio]
MRLREIVELPAYVTTKNPNFLAPSYAASSEILQNMLYKFTDTIGLDTNIFEQYAGLKNVTNPEEGVLINILQTMRSPKASGAYKASHMDKKLKGMVSEEI